MSAQRPRVIEQVLGAAPVTPAPRPVVLLLALVVLFGLAACGGQSKEDFVSDADEICNDAEEEFAKLERPERIEDVAGFAEEAKDLAEETHDKLNDLDPPDDVQDEFDAYLENGEELIEVLDELEDAGERGDEAAVRQALDSPRADTLQREREQLANDIGLKECGEGRSPS